MTLTALYGQYAGSCSTDLIDSRPAIRLTPKMFFSFYLRQFGRLCFRNCWFVHSCTFAKENVWTYFDQISSIDSVGQKNVIFILSIPRLCIGPESTKLLTPVCTACTMFDLRVIQFNEITHVGKGKVLRGRSRPIWGGASGATPESQFRRFRKTHV